MEREFESNPREVGQIYLYLQVSSLLFRDPQILTGTETFGRFGSAMAHLGDLNQDGYNGNVNQSMEVIYVSSPLHKGSHACFKVFSMVCVGTVIIMTDF